MTLSPRLKPIIIAVSLIIAAVLGAAAYAVFRPAQANFSYTTVAKHLVSQEVKTSGQVKAAKSVDLSFERSGRVARVNVQVNSVVKAGDTLVELDNGTEAAQVAQARALLDQKIAGATSADISMARAAADAAEADLEKTKADTASLVTAAQAALDTADNNLKLAKGGAESQVVAQAYETTVATVQATLPKLDDALTQADLILGIDNTAANISFLTSLSALDISKLAVANITYGQAKQQIEAAHAVANTLTTLSPHADVDAAIVAEKSALSSTIQLLSSVSDVLSATVAGSAFSANDLNNKKTIIQTTRSAITVQYNSIIAARQAIDNAGNSYATLVIIYEQAERNLTNTQASVAGLIKLKQAAYQQTLANLANKTQPPRAVDLAPLRAALYAASVNYAKTILRSPMAGIVSRQDAKIGSLAMVSVPLLSIIGGDTLQVDLLVAETDVGRIKVGNQAKVTIDAYGANTEFEATVVKVDPAISNQNGSSGYIVTLQFTKADARLKPGMTANVRVITEQKEAVLAVPEQSIIQRDGQYFVLFDGQTGRPTEKKVEIGLRGADGWWEITSGLAQGEQIINYGE